MALVLLDRVRETSATVGTISFVLSGAVLGYQEFSTIGNGNTTYYCISNQGTTEWEVGIGTYTASGALLARTTVLSSSNAGSLVNFSAGTKDVFVTYPSSKSVNVDSAGLLSAPAGLGTGVPTALNINVGSAGAFVVNGGVLGTPSSGTVTNLTGTASININGTAVTFTSTTQNSQFNSIGVGTPGSATAGEIRATNNVTAFYSSDRRLKKNIREIPDALAKTCVIGGKLFDWTDAYIAQHGGADGYFVRKSDFGVIAQDVQQVLPEAVHTREDGTLAVDYEKMCALAFAAIKELVTRIEVLEKK